MLTDCYPLSPPEGNPSSRLGTEAPHVVPKEVNQIACKEQTAAPQETLQRAASPNHCLLWLRWILCQGRAYSWLLYALLLCKDRRRNLNCLSSSWVVFSQGRRAMLSLFHQRTLIFLLLLLNGKVLASLRKSYTSSTFVIS